MADVTINYEGNSIATMSASGTKTLQTQGKYCTDDIEVVYVSPGGGGGSNTPITGTVTPVSRVTYIVFDPGVLCTHFVVVPDSETPLKSGGLTCMFQITSPDEYYKYISGKSNSAGSSSASPTFSTDTVSYATAGTTITLYSSHTGTPVINSGYFETIGWRWYAW